MYSDLDDKDRLSDLIKDLIALLMWHQLDLDLCRDGIIEACEKAGLAKLFRFCLALILFLFISLNANSKRQRKSLLY